MEEKLQPNIKNKSLRNKAIVRLEKVREIMRCNGMYDLQFESQDMETKKHFYKAIDELQAFIDNID